MSQKSIENIKPFFSVLLIILTLFSIVFLQMEERRMGYSLLKLNREHKRLIEEKRAKEIQLVKYTRPQLLDHAARNKFTLQKIQQNQIIHLSGTVDLSSSTKKDL